MGIAAIGSNPLLMAAVSLGLLAFSSNAAAQTRAASTGYAVVTILPAVTAAQVSSMDFGRVIASSVPGTMIVSPAGSVSCAGGVLCGSGAVPARFRVDGVDGMVAVSVDPLVVMHGSRGGTLLFRPIPAADHVDIVGHTADFRLGGLLEVPANAPEDRYSGSYDIKLEYQ